MKPSLFLKLFHPLNRHFVPITQSLPILSSPNSQLWSVSVNLPILDLICKWNHTIFALCILVISFNVLSGFIHTSIYQTSFLFMFIPVLCLFLHSCSFLHSIPLYVYIDMLFIHLLMDTWVISAFFLFKLLWLMLLWILIYSIWVPTFSSFGYIPRSWIARSYGIVYLFEKPKSLVFPALELCCCRQASSSGRGQGLLSGRIAQTSHCSSFSCCRVWAQQLWHLSLVAPWHVGSSWTRDQTCVPFIGRRILNHWTTRKVCKKSLISDIYCVNANMDSLAFKRLLFLLHLGSFLRKFSHVSVLTLQCKRELDCFTFQYLILIETDMVGNWGMELNFFFGA